MPNPNRLQPLAPEPKLLQNAQLTGEFYRFVPTKLRQVGFKYQRDLFGHFGCVNTVSLAHGAAAFACSGGDDKRVLIWKVFGEHGPSGPVCCSPGHLSNIFCAIFEPDNRHILSCGNDGMVLRHDVSRSTLLEKSSTSPHNEVFIGHHAAVYRLSIAPDNSNLFISASEDKTVRLWDSRLPTSGPCSGVLRGLRPVHAVHFNPQIPHMFLSGDAGGALKLWDLRMSFGSRSGDSQQKPIRKFVTDCGHCPPEVSAALFNQNGNRIIATMRWGTPTLFDIGQEKPICTFSSPGYQNCCTMKSCIFGGTDEDLILCGSDNFRIYIWRIPRDCNRTPWDGTFCNSPRGARKRPKRSRAPEEDCVEVESAEHVLTGHRSIVNNIACHPSLPLLFSAGVEKIVKIWSPYPFEDPEAESNVVARRPFSATDYVSLCSAIGTEEDEETTQEDPKALALFDFLNSELDIPLAIRHNRRPRRRPRRHRRNGPDRGVRSSESESRSNSDNDAPEASGSRDVTRPQGTRAGSRDLFPPTSAGASSRSLDESSAAPSHERECPSSSVSGVEHQEGLLGIMPELPTPSVTRRQRRTGHPFGRTDSESRGHAWFGSESESEAEALQNEEAPWSRRPWTARAECSFEPSPSGSEERSGESSAQASEQRAGEPTVKAVTERTLLEELEEDIEEDRRRDALMEL